MSLLHPEHGVVQGRLSRRILKKKNIECWDGLAGKVLQVYECGEDVQPGMGRAEKAWGGQGRGRRRAGLCLTGESGQSPSLSSSGRKVLGQTVHLATHKQNQTKAPKAKHSLYCALSFSQRWGSWWKPELWKGWSYLQHILDLHSWSCHTLLHGVSFSELFTPGVSISEVFALQEQCKAGELEIAAIHNWE